MTSADTTGTKLTEQENTEKGFTATSTLAENLQKVLVDLIELSLQAKQAHWSAVGPNFRDLHLQLDEITDAAREFSDTVAERLRALHALADGRSNVVAAATTLPQFPHGEVDTREVIDLVVERLDGVAATARTVHDDVDREDPTSADILHSIIDRVEQLSWLVASENRKPSA